MCKLKSTHSPKKKEKRKKKVLTSPSTVTESNNVWCG